jgi:hypothetical protein
MSSTLCSADFAEKSGSYPMVAKIFVDVQFVRIRQSVGKDRCLDFKWLAMSAGG